jgi:CRP-like cAMP-binding protein
VRQRTESRSAPDNAHSGSPQLARSSEISRKLKALGENERRTGKLGTLPDMGATKGLDYGNASSGIETLCMPVTSHPQENHILDALPQTERDRLFPFLKLVALPLGQVLYESGDTLRHIYFPTDSIISLLYVLEDGASAEIAVVGNEGAIGVALFMGGETTTNRAIVQSAGSAYLLTGARLKEEFGRHGEMLHILLRYTQALITQMAQTAVCNRHHSVDQQLCRWLLLSLDRLSSPKLTMTQELIANMLGVRREGVTEAAGKLQKLGVITYQRGHITVLDRAHLEQLSCECYAVVKKETDRLLPLRARSNSLQPETSGTSRD